MKQTLQEYLTTNGVDKQTAPSKIDRLKKTYWQAYYKKYEQERRNRERDVKVRLSVSEEKELVRYAKANGYVYPKGKRKDGSVSSRAGQVQYTRLVKDLVFQNLRSGSYQKQNADLVKVRQEIAKIGSNINQIVHRFHTVGSSMEGENYKAMSTYVQRLAQYVQKELQPTNLLQALEEHLYAHPDAITDVQQIMKRVATAKEKS